jgi:predicted nucleic acid-binding protein
MTLLLDTTVLIDVLCGRPISVALIAESVSMGRELATSAVNIAEVYAGMREGEEARTNAFLDALLCLPVTASIAKSGGTLKNEWARKGKTLGVVDAIVAATALEHGLMLVTDNRKDFPMPEIVFFPPA